MKIIKKFLTYHSVLVFCLFMQNPLAANWKEDFRQDFLKNLVYIQKIVIQGEVPQETQIFLNYFGGQVAWLDRTLALVSQQTDAALDALVQRKKALENLVRVQKEAEEILSERLKNVILLSPPYVVLRLMLLYEVNSLMQQDGSGDRAPSFLTTLSDQQKQLIVDKLLQKSSTQKRQISDISSNKSCLPERSLEERLADLQELLQQREEEMLDLKERYTKKLQARRKESGKLQEKIVTMNQELSTYKQALEKAQQELLSLKDQIFDQENKNKETESRLRLTEELADQRIREHLEIKRTPTSIDKIAEQERARLQMLEQELDKLIVMAKNNKF